jgi:hypothetical protein
VLELALREALQLGHNYIGTEHILLGLVREGEGVAAQVLVGLGADLIRVRRAVMALLPGYQAGGAYQGGRAMSRTRPGLGALLGQRTGNSLVPVGKEWTAQVVRAGRRPEDYASAYAELADLAAALGFALEDMDADEITCTSVDTSDGPGFMVIVTHRIEDEPPGGVPAS